MRRGRTFVLPSNQAATDNLRCSSLLCGHLKRTPSAVARTDTQARAADNQPQPYRLQSSREGQKPGRRVNVSGLRLWRRAPGLCHPLTRGLDPVAGSTQALEVALVVAPIAGQRHDVVDLGRRHQLPRRLRIAVRAHRVQRQPTTPALDGSAPSEPRSPIIRLRPGFGLVRLAPRRPVLGEHPTPGVVAGP